MNGILAFFAFGLLSFCCQWFILNVVAYHGDHGMGRTPATRWKVWR